MQNFKLCFIISNIFLKLNPDSKMSQSKGAAAKREKKTPKAAVWGDGDEDYDSEEAD